MESLMNVEVSRSTVYLSPTGNFWLICAIDCRTASATFRALAPGSVYTFICAAFLPLKPEKVVKARIGILNAILLPPRGQRRAAAAARRCVSRVSTTSPGQHFCLYSEHMFSIVGGR